EHVRFLDEVDDLRELAAGVAPTTEGVEPSDDLPAALLGDRLDLGRAQRLDVRPGARDLDRAMREAMPEGGLTHDRLVVELRQHPPDRPGEAHAGVVPAHRLRERETADDAVDLNGQDVTQVSPRHGDAEEAVADLELLHAHAVLLGEAGRGPV